MFSRLFKRLLALLIALAFLSVILVATVGPELIDDDTKAKVTGYIKGSNAGIIIFFIVIFAIAITTFTNPDFIKTLLFSKSKPNKADSHTSKNPNQIAEEDAKLRKHLKERYQKRLSQKMAGRQPVNIRRITTTVGTSKETALTFVSNIESEIQTEMTQLFQEARGRLLIVGAPGSGKTTLLLRWISELLDQEQEYLPVIVNLATWRSSFQSFEAWLEEILPVELGTPKPFAKEALKKDRLLLLCDGLDEVRKEYRETLLTAIGRYSAESRRRFVISSRIEEYQDLAKDAPVRFEIEVCPFTAEQLKTELEKLEYEPEGTRMMLAIETDFYLRKTIQTPFYLNALQLMFANSIRLQDINFKTFTLKGREEELREHYVAFILDEQNQNARNHRHWLSFLASRLNKSDINLTTFELTNLQYSWWQWAKPELRIGIFLEGMLAGIVGGLFIGAGSGMAGGFIAGLFLGLLSDISSGLIVGLIISFIGAIVGSFVGSFIGGLVGGLSNLNRYENPICFTREVFKFRWKNYILSIKECLPFSLFFGVLVGSFSILLVGLKDGLFLGLLNGIAVGLFGGTVFGLIVGIVDLLESDYSDFVLISKPYQRFNASAKVFYFSILQHWHLMHLFQKHNLLPKKIVPFLEEMTRRHILESDGAYWRFRHRILQDYFAAKWIEPSEQPTTPKANPDAG